MKHLLRKCLPLLVCFPAIGAAEEMPQWMRQAITPNIPAYARNASAVVLLTESRVTVEPGGRFITTNRRVVKVLSRDGRSRAVARAVYRTDDGRVRDLHAWVLPPSSMFKSYDKPIDVAAVNDDVYNETRIKVISASDDAEAGSIFGYEAVTEELSPFTQLGWDFQDDLPTLVSRLIVDLPEDWTAQTFTFNHAPVEAVAVRGTRSWELRDLPGIDSEPYMPSLTHLIPRLALTFVPPPGKSKSTSPAFQNWQDVSVWLAGLNDPQAQPTAALTAKAQELAAGAKSELDKVAAIARYVQGFQYISIQTGIGRGGGYRPHTAGDIFTKSYGDCKDKVTVMRAMLKAVGITSYPVAIYSGDSSYVNEVWSSPQQFNHAIIAIRISDSTVSPITLNHPPIGRLMIFDPTDPDTLLGDLPEDEQGSFGLLVAGDNGALLRMPVTSSELNQSNRYVELALEADGSIKANILEESLGHAGTSVRRDFRHQSRPDFTRQIESWISRSVTGAIVSSIEPADNWMEGRFVLKGEFKAAGYARLMNNRLLVFKPAVLNRRDWFAFAEPPRKHPVIIPAQAYSDVVRVKLPAAFTIDEMPDPVTLETSFGKYLTRYDVSENQFVIRRSLVLQSMVIPPEQYGEVRDFFQQIIAAEQAAAVLTRN